MKVMKKKIALFIAAAAGTLALIVPISSSAAPGPACVVIQRGALNIQLGYAPTGPNGCKHL
jgi:hypothetical protein